MTRLFYITTTKFFFTKRVLLKGCGDLRWVLLLYNMIDIILMKNRSNRVAGCGCHKND